MELGSWPLKTRWPRSVWGPWGWGGLRGTARGEGDLIPSLWEGGELPKEAGEGRVVLPWAKNLLRRLGSTRGGEQWMESFGYVR